ncbi:phage tail assembly protein [Novosphingobium mathurense]|uniref:Phage tail assembly chaperone protein, E, or 41 or 14 n=1 Tax=Novosphingobium mathurense TaxID=428990 RepID=A0A1U6IN75_9SPHN|nr:phage tail assembly protein [Novosphingobium mathurense]SLK09485.1 Phage tail assembly chaperone protein, E, or 41 or 14 [Novosphingobium mathurense]
MTDSSAEIRTVTLDTPIRRGEQTIETVQVRKPKAGELRGLSLSSLLNLDYAALEGLLPRITAPLLSKQDIAGLDPSDLTQLGSEVMDFLLPKGAKAALSPTT